MDDLEKDFMELNKNNQKGGRKTKNIIITNDDRKNSMTKTQNNMNIREIKYIDLFCGIGAFHTAFNELSNDKIKYECVFACDIDNDVRKLYQDNYGIERQGDINKIDYKKIPNFDVLCAGFPCQPFSIAGKKEGFDDKTKGLLFYKILDIIDIKSPYIYFFPYLTYIDKKLIFIYFNII